MKNIYTVPIIALASLTACLFPLHAQEEIKAPEIQADTLSLYTQAVAKVNQDAEYQAALAAIEAAQRNADKILYKKLREAEPKITEYVNYLEKLRTPQPPAAPAATQRVISR
jgi:hypothetical protein